jgi:phosphatidylinositol alpha-1,6-mannosyltransferase
MQGGFRCSGGDAFGVRGGIAQYNRDFFGALADSGLVSSIAALPRRAPDAIVLLADQPGSSASRPHRLHSIGAGRHARPAGHVFCGHLYIAPLAVLVARRHRAKLIVEMHGIEAWSRPSLLQLSMRRIY